MKELFFKSNKFNIFNRPKSRLFIWLFVHLAVPALLLVSLFFASPLKINTLLLDMLPRGEQSRAAAEADRILGQKSGSQAVILAAAGDFETAKKGAELFYGEFKNSAMVEDISFYFDSTSFEEFTGYFHKYRFVIAGSETLNLLETGRADEIAQDALARAYGAFNMTSLNSIEEDPFLLAERRLEDFLSSSLLSGRLSLKDDVLAAKADTDTDGRWFVLLRMTLAPGALAVRGSLVKDLYTAASSIKLATPGLDFYFSGVPFHSYESSSSAQREISIISTIAMLVILALFFAVFRSLLPVMLSILAALVSLAMATGAALFVFREIHIITFVFGTSLIGTCVDYSIHFFVHWKGNPHLHSGLEIKSYISKSLIMSFISTEICFLVFLFAPFLILKQFAVFSMAGILSSFLTAYCLFPYLKIPDEKKRQVANFSQNPFLNSLLMKPAFRHAAIIIIFASSLAVIFFSPQRVKIKNDITSLYTMSPSMMEGEKLASMVLDYGSYGWYFLISGATAEETLENEERFLEQLDKEKTKGNLSAYLATTLFVPSLKTQKQTYEAMKALLPLAAAQYDSLGFGPDYTGGSGFSSFMEEFAGGETYCRPEDAPQALGVSNLWIGNAGGSYFSCVMPLHPKEEAIFRSLAEEYNFVHFINKAADIGRDLDTLTKTIFFLFLVACIVVFILVFFVYSLKDSFRIFAVPILLLLSSLAVLTANRIPLGFFPAAALILVLGLGLDYIFYMIGRKNIKLPGGELTFLAVILSFLTTLLSFGALALSSFVPVHFFGLTVSAGLSTAFISAILLAGRDK